MHDLIVDWIIESLNHQEDQRQYTDVYRKDWENRLKKTALITLDLDVYFSRKWVLYSINKTVSVILRF